MMPDKTQSIRFDILSLNFNQNFECFVSGDADGFRIFNVNPLKQIRQESLPGGVHYAEMLYRCNYVALVGAKDSSSSHHYNNSKVLIWDCSLAKVVVDLDVGEPALAVRLRRDLIIVVQKTNVSIFSFSDIPVQLFCCRTWPNERGLCTVSASHENPFLAYPSITGVGTFEVVNLVSRERRRIRAHSHNLYAMAFNAAGNLIATASEKGTLIRIFDFLNGNMLREFRRGSSSAKISCINFSVDSKLLCVSSNHSTIHIFELEKSFQRSKKLGRFLKGEVSSLRIYVGDNKAKEICQCAFYWNTDSVIALGKDGSYYNFYFDKPSGQYYQQNYCLFIELNNNRSLEDVSNNNL